MPEWLIGAVSKTVELGDRLPGFKSLPLRHISKNGLSWIISAEAVFILVQFLFSLTKIFYRSIPGPQGQKIVRFSVEFLKSILTIYPFAAVLSISSGIALLTVLNAEKIFLPLSKYKDAV